MCSSKTLASSDKACTVIPRMPITSAAWRMRSAASRTSDRPKPCPWRLLSTPSRPKTTTGAGADMAQVRSCSTRPWGWGLHRFAQALVSFWRHIKPRQELRAGLRACRNNDVVEQCIFCSPPSRFQNEIRAVLAARLGCAINPVAVSAFSGSGSGIFPQAKLQWRRAGRAATGSRKPHRPQGRVKRRE